MKGHDMKKLMDEWVDNYLSEMKALRDQINKAKEDSDSEKEDPDDIYQDLQLVKRAPATGNLKRKVSD